ncbi:hypothetical protein [Burkholderia anthina]|uniref:hypothetical protein n=1 Tax=Burkholderia anthina TaxID=179879 RepID=UPI00158863E7|nr:hypothetical protein [Burkholderia anthina]
MKNPVPGQRQANLNNASPAAADAKLGDVQNDLITAFNALLSQYQALLAHLDVANVTGIGSANASTYGANLQPVKGLDAR